MKKSGWLLLVGIFAVYVMISALNPVMAEVIRKSDISEGFISGKSSQTPEILTAPGIKEELTGLELVITGPGGMSVDGAMLNETERLHPALSVGAGYVLQFWENIFYGEPIEYTVQMRSSDDDGQTWFTPTVWADSDPPGYEGYFPQADALATYPSLRYWGSLTRFYGTMVAPPEYNLGGDPQLIRIEDPMDQSTWDKWRWAYNTIGTHDMAAAEIATNSTVEYPSNRTDQPFGVQGIIMSYDAYYNIPMLFYQGESAGSHYSRISYYTSLIGCQSIDAAIDDLGQGASDLATAYSCFDYREPLAGDQYQLFIRRDLYAYAVDFDNILYPDPGDPDLYYFYRAPQNEHLEHPVIDAYDDVIVVLVELVDENNPGDVDILSLSTDDGNPGSMTIGVFSATAANERFPELIHVGGETFFGVYWQENQLYARKSSTGGDVWGNPYLVSDPTHVVPMDYRVADIAEGGEKLIYSYTTAKATETYLNIVDNLQAFIPTNEPPVEPQAVYPADAETHIPTDVILEWTGGDADGDAITYQVFMDAFTPPTSLVGTSYGDTYLDVGTIDNGKTYYWKVEATDKDGTTTSQIFSFTTLMLNGCDNPIVINLPADIPYSDVNYTCGRGDSVNTSCLGDFDTGEDIMYQVNVTAETGAYFRLDPLGFTNTGMVLDDACPPATDCIKQSTNTSTGPHGFSAILAPGTYYLMIDHNTPPSCIASFEFSIEPGCCDLAGDANNDGGLNVGDAVYINNYVFRESQCATNPPIGCPPPCEAEGNANGDGAVNIGDAVYINNHIFRESQCATNPPIGCPPVCGP